MNLPQWAKPERRAHLVSLWQELGNRCLLGHPNCPELLHYLHHRKKAEVVAEAVKLPVMDKERGLPKHGVYLDAHLIRRVVVETSEWIGGLYFLKEGELIQDWVADDREERAALERLERARLHQDETRFRRGQFDTLRRQSYREAHPVYHLEGIGVSALTRQRVAKVRIALTRVRLWVELPSKSAQRKARRYSKGEAQSINQAIVQAVKDYQGKHPGS